MQTRVTRTTRIGQDSTRTSSSGSGRGHGDIWSTESLSLIKSIKIDQFGVAVDYPRTFIHRDFATHQVLYTQQDLKKSQDAVLGVTNAVTVAKDLMDKGIDGEDQFHYDSMEEDELLNDNVSNIRDEDDDNSDDGQLILIVIIPIVIIFISDIGHDVIQ